jgi:catechol 2,3-dioxygenase
VSPSRECKCTDLDYSCYVDSTMEKNLQASQICNLIQCVSMEIKELGHVVLYVSNLTRSADFYRDTLGFREIARFPGVAAFSSGRTHHELLLIEVGGEPRRKSQPEPGLYHVGLKIGNSPAELKAVYHELKEKNVDIIGSSDHSVTHSLYILDPDGNELELYADVSDDWKQDPSAVMRPIKPLDLE